MKAVGKEVSGRGRDQSHPLCFEQRPELGVGTQSSGIGRSSGESDSGGTWVGWIRARAHGGRRGRVGLAGGGTGLVILAMAVNLGAAFATKVPYLAGPSREGTLYWYSDIRILFVLRHLGDHVFPYVHGSYVTSGTGSVFLTRGEVEYPVLTGVFMWLVALPIHSQDAYFILSALALAPFGIVGAWLLAKMSGPRAFPFAAAPAVALYGFINWDLISVCLAVAGVYMWWRQRQYVAAAAFAVGGCVKLWPALLLVPLVADLVAGGQWRKGLRAGFIGVGIGVGVNLPFAIVNLRGWYAPFAYQSALGLDWREGMSLWDWYGRGLRPELAETLASVAMLGGLGVLTALGWTRYRREGVFPFLQVCAATTVLYILTAKDNSAQYVLWVLPFFAMLRLRPALWVLWSAVGVAWYVRFVFVLGPAGFALVTMLEVVAGSLLLVSAMRSDSALLPGREGRGTTTNGPLPARELDLGTSCGPPEMAWLLNRGE